MFAHRFTDLGHIVAQPSVIGPEKLICDRYLNADADSEGVLGQKRLSGDSFLNLSLFPTIAMAHEIGMTIRLSLRGGVARLQYAYQQLC